MDIAIHIPKWILWTIGVPVGIGILFFAVIGAWMIWAFRDGIYK